MSRPESGFSTFGHDFDSLISHRQAITGGPSVNIACGVLDRREIDGLHPLSETVWFGLELVECMRDACEWAWE